MKHWTEYDPNAGVNTNVTFGVNPKLWHYIEQTRGDKTRAQYIREILIEIMENTPVSHPSEERCPQADYDGYPCYRCKVKDLPDEWFKCVHNVVSERGPDWWKEAKKK